MAKTTKVTREKPAAADSVEPSGSVSTMPFPDAFQLFEPSCKVVLNNFTQFAWLLGGPFIISILLGLAQLSAMPAPHQPYTVSGTAMALTALLLLVSVLVSPGVILLQLNAIRMHPMSAGEAFNGGLQYVLKFIGLGIVLVFGLTIAFLLFIVPFFIVLPRVVLSAYYLVDRNLGVFDAIRASNEAYKKHRAIWGIIGVNFLIAIPSIIPFIGRIVTTSLSYLYEPAFAMRYEQIKLAEAGKMPRTPFEVKLKP